MTMIRVNFQVASSNNYIKRMFDIYYPLFQHWNRMLLRQFTPLFSLLYIYTYFEPFVVFQSNKCAHRGLCHGVGPNSDATVKLVLAFDVI